MLPLLGHGNYSNFSRFVKDHTQLVPSSSTNSFVLSWLPISLLQTSFISKRGSTLRLIFGTAYCPKNTEPLNSCLLCLCQLRMLTCSMIVSTSLLCLPVHWALKLLLLTELGDIFPRIPRRPLRYSIWKWWMPRHKYGAFCCCGG